MFGGFACSGRAETSQGVAPITRIRPAPRSIAGLIGVLRWTPPSMYQPCPPPPTQRAGKANGKADEAMRWSRSSSVFTYWTPDEDFGSRQDSRKTTALSDEHELATMATASNDPRFTPAAKRGSGSIWP